MKGILYIIIVGLSLFAPVQRLDVAKLAPVEAIAISVDGDGVVVQTDDGHWGRGDALESALQNLRDNTPAVIYLDTARYLLLGEGAQGHQVQMQGYLKDSVYVAQYRGGDVKEEAKYLDAHRQSGRPKVGF